MTTALMMAGSSLGEDRKPQMEIDVEGTTDIVPPLTKSLNLTCSLVPATDSDPKDKKADFKRITGVYIDLKKADSDEEADVAKITIANPGNATLSGLLPRATIIEFSLSKGFIIVGVAWPDINHARDYTCKVVGINTAEDHVTLTTHKTSVQHTAPDVAKLANYIHTLELQLEEKVDTHDTDINNIKTENRNQETDIYNIETKNRNQDTEINKRVSKADIQQGYKLCSPGTGPNTVYEQVNFPHRYSKAPRVFLSTRHIHGNDVSGTDDDTGIEYWINADQVTQTGFRLKCHVYRYSHIEWMSVQWIATPNP